MSRASYYDPLQEYCRARSPMLRSQLPGESLCACRHPVCLQGSLPQLPHLAPPERPTDVSQVRGNDNGRTGHHCYRMAKDYPSRRSPTSRTEGLIKTPLVYSSKSRVRHSDWCAVAHPSETLMSRLRRVIQRAVTRMPTPLRARLRTRSTDPMQRRQAVWQRMSIWMESMG